MGVAILDYDEKTNVVEYVYSTYWETHKPDSMKYQEYRLRVVQEMVENAEQLFAFHEPDQVACEVLPVRGFTNSSQVFLAHAALAAVQGIAFAFGAQVTQVAAVTVKKRIGGSPKATKVAVRNGVLQLLPELAPKKSKWTKVFDESDAIAIGLTTLGYSNSTP
jgi:Holliday junction resolvasome RuvABC endonuclease subunit